MFQQVEKLLGGTARMVSAIKDYAPGGPEYDPSDTVTVIAANQFLNRVAVSDYMAEILEKPPLDWKTATQFGPIWLNVTGDESTVISAMNQIDDMVPTVPACGAFIAPDVWFEFDCYHLAAIGKTTNDDPFTPSWHLNGGYWQWGRNGPVPSHWYDTNTEYFAHGPTGPYEAHANSASISDWEQGEPLDGQWSDSHKTVNDPCPSGFRIPTISQWEGVEKNNVQNNIGSWSYSTRSTNYISARFFGNNLMLPAAVYRGGDGRIVGRGGIGYYWSSSWFDTQYDWNQKSLAWNLYFLSHGAYTGGRSRTYVQSVRCVAE